MNTMKVEVVVPDWVNWIAVDENGEVWGWEKEPSQYNCNSHSFWDAGYGMSSRLYNAPPPKNWKEELYTWS